MAPTCDFGPDRALGGWNQCHGTVNDRAWARNRLVVNASIRRDYKSHCDWFCVTCLAALPRNLKLVDCGTDNSSKPWLTSALIFRVSRGGVQDLDSIRSIAWNGPLAQLHQRAHSHCNDFHNSVHGESLAHNQWLFLSSTCHDGNFHIPHTSIPICECVCFCRIGSRSWRSSN